MTSTAPGDLLTLKEVAALVGVAPTSISRYRQRGIMPEPDAMFGRTPTWTREHIEAWDALREKRPRKAAVT